MQLSFLLVKLSWILAISYARTEEEGGPPRLYSHSPWILSHSRDWNGGAEEQGGPAWARHPVQPPAPPGRAPLGQGRGEGTRGPARTWRAARVAAGAAAARAGGRGWSRGARRGAWAARARRAAARKAASAPATCRRRPSGRCCSGTAPPSSRPRTGTRTPARSPGISSPRVSGAHRRQTGERRRLPGGAPGMPWPRLLARPALPAEGTGPARRPGRWSWAWGRPARLRWGVERGPAETRPRAPCAARALHCPLRLCGDGPQAGREPAPCDCWRRSPNGCGGPSWPRAQPLGPRALGPRSGSQPFEKRQPMGPRIRVWTSFHPSLYFVGLGNA